MTARRPDFVIIGAQKAGSSLLHHALRGHPDVWLHPQEDPFFRDPVFDPKGLAPFEGAYAGRAEDRVGMKCPDYLARPEVPARLRAYLDAPDLVVTLREPVARALSAYYWWMRWGVVPVRHPEEGLRAALGAARRGSDEPATQLLTWGLYGTHLARWREHFPPEKIFVTLDHELRRDPVDVVRRVYEFLGVRSDVAPPTSSTDDNPGVYALPRLRFLQHRNRHILRWDESGTYPSIPRARGPWPWTVSTAVAVVDRYLLARWYGNAKPALSAELTAELHEFYRADITAVETLLGIDLTRWRPASERPAAPAPPPVG